jgi:hypothetical protein
MLAPLRIFMGLSLLAVFSSCATVISGGQQRIHVITEPIGAAVYVNREFRDSTPCIVKIKRTWDSPPQLLISKKGYKDETLELDKKMNELIFLNFINVFGWAIDGATASCIRYSLPDTILLTPRKKTP